jgi:hypothetical protein
MKWISVKQELPSGIYGKIKTEYNKHISQEVLFCNDIAMFVGVYNSNEETWYSGEVEDGNQVYDVTHWMELPLRP